MVKEMDGFQTSIPGPVDEGTYDIGPTVCQQQVV